MTFTPRRSPSVLNAKHIDLPRDEDEADELVRSIIEGRADEYRKHEREGQAA